MAVFLKQFVLVEVTRNPLEFTEKLDAAFGNRFIRYSNPSFLRYSRYRNEGGPGIICESFNMRSLWEYADDCGAQLARQHYLVQLEFVEMFFHCMESMRSRSDVRHRRPPQRCHVVIDVQ